MRRKPRAQIKHVRHIKKKLLCLKLESNKDIEERFMCVDCMKDSPKKYKTIEDLDEQWTNFNSEQDKVLQKQKKKKLDQTSKLQTQITEIRKKFNSQLNDLEDALIKEQIESNNQINQMKQIISITIYDLNDEDLSEAMKILNKVEKASTVDSRLINYQNCKDQIFYQDIESRLERLKQHNILDIQQSINIINENANDDNELKQLSEMVIQLIKQPQSDQQNKATLDLINKEFNEFLRNTKQYKCHIDYFNNTVKSHQDYMSKLEPLGISYSAQIIKNWMIMIVLNYLISTLKSQRRHLLVYRNFVNLKNTEKKFKHKSFKQNNQKQNMKELEEKLTNKQSDYLKMLVKQIKLENLTRSLKQQRTYLIEKNTQLDQLETFLEQQNQFQEKQSQFQENQIEFIQKSTQFQENQYNQDQNKFTEKSTKFQEDQTQFTEKSTKFQDDQIKFTEKSTKSQEDQTLFQNQFQKELQKELSILKFGVGIDLKKELYTQSKFQNNNHISNIHNKDDFF